MSGGYESGMDSPLSSHRGERTPGGGWQTSLRGENDGAFEHGEALMSKMNERSKMKKYIERLGFRSPTPDAHKGPPVSLKEIDADRYADIDDNFGRVDHSDFLSKELGEQGSMLLQDARKANKSGGHGVIIMTSSTSVTTSKESRRVEEEEEPRIRLEKGLFQRYVNDRAGEYGMVRFPQISGLRDPQESRSPSPQERRHEFDITFGTEQAKQFVQEVVKKCDEIKNQLVLEYKNKMKRNNLNMIFAPGVNKVRMKAEFRVELAKRTRADTIIAETIKTINARKALEKVQHRQSVSHLEEEMERMNRRIQRRDSRAIYDSSRALHRKGGLRAATTSPVPISPHSRPGSSESGYSSGVLERQHSSKKQLWKLNAANVKQVRSASPQLEGEVIKIFSPPPPKVHRRRRVKLKTKSPMDNRVTVEKNADSQTIPVIDPALLQYVNMLLEGKLKRERQQHRPDSVSTPGDWAVQRRQTKRENRHFGGSKKKRDKYSTITRHAHGS